VLASTRDWKDVVALANHAYEYQKLERHQDRVSSLDRYVGVVGSNWPCLWGSEATGRLVGPSGLELTSWKYTCGLPRLKSACIIYTFGSNGNYGFESGVIKSNPLCEIHIFDQLQTSGNDLQAWFPNATSKVVHHVRDHQLGFNMGEVKAKMQELNHQHVDVLAFKTNIHQFTVPEKPEDWASVGQFLVEVTVEPRYTDKIVSVVEKIERGDYRLFHKQLHGYSGPKRPDYVAFSFIRRLWHPDCKLYSPKLPDISTFTVELKGHIDIAEFTYQNQEMERHDNKMLDMNYALSSFNPNWPCFGTEGITGSLETWQKKWDIYKDGWKFTCGLTDLSSTMTEPDPKQTKECIVYSLGSAGNMAFEQDVLRRRPNCKIYIFDKDNFGMDQWFSTSEIQNSVIFTRAFISHANAANVDPPQRTIQSIMEQYGHTYIDVLKMDIEGAEFDILTAPLPGMGQLQVEVHFSDIPPSSHLDIYSKLFSNLELHGLRLFHKEINARYDLNCIELAFVHKNWTPDGILDSV
jgi:hypothetical protein